MSRAVLLLVVSLAFAGCQQQHGAVVAGPEQSAATTEAGPALATPHVVPAAANEPAINELPIADKAPKLASTAEEIFDALTAHSWSSLPPNQPKFPPMDYSVATYRADGTWSFEFFTDYHIPAKTGKWNLQSVQGQWLLCQDDGGRGSVATNGDGTISLGVGKLYPHEPLARDPGQTAKTLPKLTLVPEVQEIVNRLTAHEWKRANDLDLAYDPTQVRFHKDWTYSATYRGGECKSEGTWYAKTDEIVAHSPKGRCDRPSDTSTGDWLTAQVIDDRKILINWDLYVPKDEPMPRGIIWHLFGFDEADTRIEYDMPIRRGHPVRFDVTITNRSISPLKLERFALSHGYSDYGRSLGEPGKAIVPPADEIAAHDLAGATLAPGKAHAFHVMASFPDAGTPTVYFNVLVSGLTQNWDTHQSHWPSVME
jgi:hypothetical protein